MKHVSLQVLLSFSAMVSGRRRLSHEKGHVERRANLLSIDRNQVPTIFLTQGRTSNIFEGSNTQQTAQVTYMGKKSKQRKSKKSSSKSYDGNPPWTPPVPVVRPPVSPPLQPPVKPPVSQPTNPACQADESGGFGSRSGDETVLSFPVQLQATAGTTTQDINNQIVDDVEDVLTDSLIPELFYDQCGGASRKLRTNRATGGKYLGLDTAVYFEPTAQCSGIFVRPCYVIRVSITVFTEGKSSNEIREGLIEELVQLVESGHLQTELADEIEGISIPIEAFEPNPLQPTIIIRPPTRPPQSAPIRAPPTSPIAMPTIRPPVASPIAQPPIDRNILSPTAEPTLIAIPPAQTTIAISGLDDKPPLLELPTWAWLSILFAIFLLWVIRRVTEKPMEI